MGTSLRGAWGTPQDVKPLWRSWVDPNPVPVGEPAGVANDQTAVEVCYFTSVSLTNAMTHSSLSDWFESCVVELCRYMRAKC